ncbi:MAG: glycoside hydrolase family 2 [Kiritimatiellaeota bacterium]|nr:glycoside hydrolase family 2 [Kiritimatiellota bacterium]
MTHGKSFAMVVLVAGALAAQAADWQPVPGNLMTRWAKDVSPDKALPEYPRPQMERKTWQNLNGLWDYAIVPLEAPKPQRWDGKILVPFCVESALSGVKKPLTDKEHLWYRRTFTVPSSWKDQRVLLHFGAVDWDATVWVNGKELDHHRGGYDAFSFDITDALKAGDNEIVLAVFDATGGFQPKGKQHFPAIKNPGGIMYTPCSGIWQTTWLEPVPAAHISSLKIVPDVDRGIVSVTAQVAGQLKDGQHLSVTVRDGSKEIAEVEGKPSEAIELKIPNAKLWSPENPFLYNLNVEIEGKGGLLGEKTFDEVESYFGMRKISVAKDDKGFLRILLNNQFVLQVGFLDQGFWPDGIYTAPTDAALRYDIEMTKKLGMNMARKHVKVEPDRWYYWCDKLGLLVWQDMPAGGFGHGAGHDKKSGEVHDGTPVSPEAEAQYRAECSAMIAQRGNHPSIVQWVPFNEGWGQFKTKEICDWIKQLDPTRLVDNASGWHDVPAGDVIDMHNYPGPGCPKPDGKRAAVLGEFGGLGLPVPGHTWVEKSWGYRGMPSATALTRKYCELLRKVYELKDSDGLNACVYTQTTDCETECNGLLTYDRELKPDLAKVAAANQGRFAPPPKIETVVPTARDAALDWRFTLAKPAADWFQPNFDDTQWQSAPGGSPGSVVRTKWNTADIWIRRTFDLPAGATDNLSVLLHHDEDAEVYLNGVLAVTAKNFTTDYESAEIAPAALAALKPGGKNAIAIHCHQIKGGQFIDAGLVRVVETPTP